MEGIVGFILLFCAVVIGFIIYCFRQLIWGEEKFPQDPYRPVSMEEAFDLYYKGKLKTKSNTIDEVYTMYTSGQIKRK